MIFFFFSKAQLISLREELRGLVCRQKQVLKALEESTYYSKTEYDQKDLHNLRGKLAELSAHINSLNRQVSWTRAF